MPIDLDHPPSVVLDRRLTVARPNAAAEALAVLGRIGRRNRGHFGASANRRASARVAGIGPAPADRQIRVGRPYWERMGRRYGIASAHAICPSKPSDVAMSR
jgi:hypothetical protein